MKRFMDDVKLNNHMEPKIYIDDKMLDNKKTYKLTIMEIILHGKSYNVFQP
jgi:hypothetical protein